MFHGDTRRHMKRTAVDRQLPLVTRNFSKKIMPLLSAFVWMLLVTSLAWAAVPDTGTIPPELERWTPWVLHGREARFCPATYNNGEAFHCLWPSRLQLSLEAKGGRFSQEWHIFVKDWVPLPGGANLWPRDVKVDGKPAAVIVRGESPAVHLTPGKHVVEGSFFWDAMPEMMNVPAASGLVSLSIDGRRIEVPHLDEAGRLWLRQRAAAGSQEDRVEVRIYRLFDDTIPMQTTNLLKLNVSGQAREVKLDGVLLDKAVPMSLQSPLPARLGPTGELLLQVRPGRWELRIVSRFDGPVHQLGPVSGAYGQEVWSFQARNALRMVQIEGISGVDPKQTDAPREWEKFPAYLVPPGAVMTFEEIRRGDPDPAPDRLNLKRTWWLDFAGTGFTIQDRIGGTMSRQWYLAMNPPALLGRVSVDGADQLITSQGPEKKAGVELRKGHLNLVAESRYETSRRVVPAVGWDHDFESVSGVLNLPPGWRLLSAAGVDVIPGTWFERWTLLDLFVVLIISLAVLKLWHWRWGLLALVTLGLTYHEPGAPRLIWLGLLATVALLRYLPAGWGRRWVSALRLVALVYLLVLAIPFMVQQVRWGIYPQLEVLREARGMVWDADVTSLPEPPREEEEPPTPAPAARKRTSPAPSISISESSRDQADAVKRKAALAQDPKALIQTGPGLPAWTWRTITMKWNGPVARNQEIRLWLLSPAVNLVLAFVRVLLLALLVLLLLDLRRWKERGLAGAVAVLLCGLLFLPQPAVAAPAEAVFPPADLLKQLETRLLKPPECLPTCAQSPHLELQVTTETLQLLLQVHAAADTAVPLPGNMRTWLPEKVLVNARPAEGLFRDKDGVLWLLVPAGLHTVTLQGKVPAGDDFQLSLPLRPHQVRILSTGWDVQGVHADGQVEASLQLTRQAKEGMRPGEPAGITLPPFLQIERELSLGLNWQVATKVRRLTPPGSAVVVAVPLLAGESVTTPGIRVADGKALVNMEPASSAVAWSSVLERRPEIRLEAAGGEGGVAWSETWILDASPIWHCDLVGIPVIHHQDGAGFWKPQWQPWPGESVTIRVTRPEAIPGQLVTIDEARLELTPGERFNKADLALAIRTSQGGQHTLTLPPEAGLQQVQINGKDQPIRQEGRAVVIPLQPGMQTVSLGWHQDRKEGVLTRAPEVTIGGPDQRAVNATVSFRMERSRWLLWARGPRLGPAVLFWSYLLVVVLAAWGLGRVPWTPLKTRHWLLLGLGLTQTEPIVALLIVGWLLALGLREKHALPEAPFTYDLVQVLLVVWTLAALGGLYLAIERGLLGIPDMQIAGNGSSDYLLRWTEDRIGAAMPQPWMLSLPMFVYRTLMLLWALWLAQALLRWLSWGWHCFSQGGIWRKLSRKHAEPPPAVDP